jgi:hypothetical protein
MEVNVFLKIGKEINEQTKAIITNAFLSKNMRIDTELSPGSEKVGFIIRSSVPDAETFVKSVYKTLQHVPSLFLVAPPNCLERIKHHPRVHCFDCKIMDDPEIGVQNVISYAYHGRPLS